MASLPAELVRPLSVVDALFQQAAGKMQAAGPLPTRMPASWGERDHFVQALGLQDEEAFARIPCLNDVELVESIPPFSLVRYRGLVQDVFEPETYAAFVEERPDVVAASAGGVGRVIPTKYRERVLPAPGSVLQDLKQDGLGMRGVCYMVPVPAETPWARASAAEWSRPGSEAAAALCAGREGAGAAKLKRSRDDDVVMTEEAPSRPRTDLAPQCLPCGAAVPAGTLPGSVGALPTGSGAAAVSSDEFGLNFPLPHEEGRGSGFQPPCLVKLYDDLTDAVKVCQCVEVVGVLCVDPELASMEKQSEFVNWLSGNARNPSTSMVPRLHALLVRSFPFQHPLLPFSPDWLSEARLAAAYQQRLGAPEMLAGARATAIAELARGLGGDQAAAEYMLMLLVSRSFGKVGETLLGNWSLNLARWPETASTAELAAAVRELVPRCAHLELSVGNLNNQRWRPRKDYDANRLVAGQLQLASGTVLLIDETGMGEGQLTADGFRNANAVSTLVTERSLVCDFMCEVKLPLELLCVAVSRHRSLVKEMDVVLPLQPSPQAAAGARPEARPEALGAARFLIGLVTRRPGPVVMSAEVQEQVGNDFVQARQQFRVPSELCHTWMGLARASCLLQGERELTADGWQRVLRLERERLTRCGQLGLLGQQ